MAKQKSDKAAGQHISSSFIYRISKGEFRSVKSDPQQAGKDAAKESFLKFKDKVASIVSG